MPRASLTALTMLLWAVPIASAQLAPNMSYDGRPTLVRIQYTPLPSPDGCQGADSPAGAGWGHDYPMSVQGLLTAVRELVRDDIVADSNLVLTVEDTAFVKHPVAMLTEPGCWEPTENEAKALGAYLRKGGFLIADDFTFSDCTPEHCELAIQRFEVWIKRVLPGARVVPLAHDARIFNDFLRVDIDNVPGWGSGPGKITGIYEDNDPTKRLLVVCNYWTTLGQYWRYVGTDIGSGLERGGSAYRLGLNYWLYGLSH